MPVRITSASCTKSSLNSQTESVPVTLLTGTLLFWGAADSCCAGAFGLFADDKKDERAGLHLAAAFAWSGRIEISGMKKDVVSLEVEGHGAGASLGGDIFHDGVIVRGIFVDYGEGAFAVRSEGELRRGIEAVGVYTFANRGRGDHFSRVRVHDGHHFIVATREEAAILAVDGEAGSFLTRLLRPAMRDGELLRIELHELGSVLDVDVDAALAVGDSKFGLTAERKRADDSTVSGVDGGGVLAAAVEREDALGAGVVDDGVGIGTGVYGADGLESFQIEDGRVVGTAVAGEAAAEVGRDGDAVRTLCVWDAADDSEGVRVQHNDLGGV